jgi:hypothetical protein
MKTSSMKKVSPYPWCFLRNLAAYFDPNLLHQGEIVQGIFPGQAIMANSLAIEVRARSPFRLPAQAG